MANLIIKIYESLASGGFIVMVLYSGKKCYDEEWELYLFMHIKKGTENTVRNYLGVVKCK